MVVLAEVPDFGWKKEVHVITCTSVLGRGQRGAGVHFSRVKLSVPPSLDTCSTVAIIPAQLLIHTSSCCSPRFRHIDWPASPKDPPVYSSPTLELLACTTKPIFVCLLFCLDRVFLFFFRDEISLWLWLSEILPASAFLVLGLKVRTTMSVSMLSSFTCVVEIQNWVLILEW